MSKKLLASQTAVREMLMETKKVPSGLAKKIARATKNGQEAVKTWNSLKSSFKNIEKSGIILNTKKPAEQLEQVFNKYIQALNKERTRSKIKLDLEDTMWRPEEFYIYYIIGDILKYDPWDTAGGYTGGDYNLQEYNMSIQIKSPTDKLRIYYSADYARRELKRNGFSEEMTQATVDSIKQAFSKNFTKKALNNKENKLQFMKYYKDISRANWYIFFYENGDQISAISVSKHSLLQFVEVFSDFFVPESETTKGATGLAFLRINFTSRGFILALWQGILSTQDAIHYANAKAFYRDRQIFFKNDPLKIQRYNDQFWADYGHGHIQNSFFAPVKYR